MTNLGDKLLKEITRVRDEVLPEYLEVAKIAPMTVITISMMRVDLDRAVKALADGDAVECVRAYEKLKGWNS